MVGERKRKVALVRFHDGSAKPNWGGRLTSMALAGIIHRSPSLELWQTINGTVITKGFDEYRDSLFPLGAKMFNKAISLLGMKKKPRLRPYDIIDDVAETLIKQRKRSEPLAKVINAIQQCDEVWMNGEGNYILCKQNTLWRTLLLLSISNQLGKVARLVNSILSYPTYGGTDSSVIAAVGLCLARCKSILYRDPTSLALHRELYPQIEADWAPDALFAWAVHDNSHYSSEESFGPSSERLDPLLQLFLEKKEPYILVSGASGLREGFSKQMVEVSTNLINRLKTNGFATILVATDKADSWLQLPARKTNSFYVEADIPLCSATRLVAGSSAFVSGRYHPSILAANLGVPTIQMESNSHKTRSFQTMLGIEQPVVFPFFSDSQAIDPMNKQCLIAAGSDGPTRERIRQRAQALGKAVVEKINAF